MTDGKVVAAVIRYLGLVALVLCVGVLVLFTEVLDASTGREALDPSVVAMFGSVCTLAGGVIGGLTAMLVSTHSGGPQAQPVEIVNEDDNAVPVAEQP